MTRTKDRSKDAGRQVERRENDNGIHAEARARTHTHTPCRSAVIAEEENESQQCLSFSQPDCQTVSVVLSALCLSPPFLFFFLVLSLQHTVISLRPAPPARVESKASVSLPVQLVITVRKTLRHEEKRHVWFNLS